MKKLYEEDSIQDIADAVREKGGSTDTYTVAQMAPAIRALSTGGIFEDNIPKIPATWLTVNADPMIRFQIYVNSFVNIRTSIQRTISWGDGSSTTLKGSNYSSTHTYSSSGVYIVSINAEHAIVYNGATSKGDFLYSSLNYACDGYNNYLDLPGLIQVYSRGFKAFRQQNIGSYNVEGNGSYVLIINELSVLPAELPYLINKVIYVADEVLDTYKSGTNYSSVSDHIFPISQCPYIDWNS